MGRSRLSFPRSRAYAIRKVAASIASSGSGGLIRQRVQLCNPPKRNCCNKQSPSVQESEPHQRCSVFFVCRGDEDGARSERSETILGRGALQIWPIAQKRRLAGRLGMLCVHGSLSQNVDISTTAEYENKIENGL
jgi:hypothetical protein